MSAKLTSPATALRRAFSGLPARIEVAAVAGSGRDVAVSVRLGGHTYRLTARWVGQGWPSEAKRAVPEVGDGWPAGLVVTARRFSRGALQWLRQVGANWADEGGQARIVRSPGLAIVRESVSEPEDDQDGGVRWSASAVEVAEYVLSEAVREGTGRLEIRTGEVASATGWSSPQVSHVLHMFDTAGWTFRRGGRSGPSSWRELVDAAVLLEAWTHHVGQQTPRVLRGHRISGDLVRFARMEMSPAFKVHGVQWALTGWAALELLAPFTTAIPQLQVYVAGAAFDTVLPNALRELAIVEVSEGSRFEFRRADFNLLRQEVLPPGDPVAYLASVPRVYADLVALGGRAAEAAAHLREVRIGF